jgi:hypothetical protein
MIRVRQLDRSVGECTAALGLVFLEVTDMAQPGPGAGLPDRPRGRRPAGCSHTEKLALYSGTAKRLYHLD